MNSRWQRLFLALIIGLLAMMGLFGGLALAGDGPATPTAPTATTRYVAPTGSDAGDCSDPANPCRTIQYAVNLAADGDTIRIAAFDNTTAARYTGSGTTPVITLTKSIVLNGSYLYVHGGSGTFWTPGLVPATVDGEGARRAISITGPAAPTLQSLAFVNGSGTLGGNLYAENASLTIRTSSALSGTATTGGGLYLKDCDANITTLTVISNTATADAGGLYVEGGELTLTGGTIRGNAAGTDGKGGGFHLKNSAATIVSADIYSNTAYTGAGLYVEGPAVFNPLNPTIFAGNYIRYNQAGGQGGGLYLNQASVGLANNVIADNQAATGAAIYFYASSPYLYYNTFARNAGANGLYVTHKPGTPVIPSVPTMANTIVASHTVGLRVESTGRPLKNRISLDGTLWWSNGTDLENFGVVTRTLDVYGDPAFTCLGVPPACQDSYHLLAGSAAIDAGAAVSMTVLGLYTLVDIDNQLRPSGYGYDIGADEFMSTMVVLLPPLSTETAVPGQTVTHTHRLLNSGTITDTYDLAVASSSGWATLATATSITLSPEASATVQVRVTVPLSATSALSDTTNITATSRASGVYRAYARDVTLVSDVAPGQVEIDGPTSGAVSIAYPFTATVGPITTTTPITYRWEATGQSAVTHTAGLSDAATFAWSTTGPQTITVTATNVKGFVTATHAITVYASRSLALQPGWNLIALPLVPADPNLPAALASIAGEYDLVFAYDGCDAADPWKKYAAAAPPFTNDLTALAVQDGYWVHATQAATLIVTGTLPGTTDIPLCTGWNLIGYPSAAAVALPGALAGIAGQYDLVYAYDAADPSDPWKLYAPGGPPPLNDLTEMGPDKGYWLRTTQDTTLVVGP